MEGRKTMSNEIAVVNGLNTSEAHNSNLNKEERRNTKNSNRKQKMKIYAVYNPDNNPSFYLHNKLNWYKNFE